MAKSASGPGEPRKDRVKFSGRSARPSKRVGTTSVQGKRPGAPLGAWRKQLRETTKWDQKSLIIMGSCACLVLVFLLGMFLTVRNELYKQKVKPPKPVSDGIRLQDPSRFADEDFVQSGLSGSEYHAIIAIEEHLDDFELEIQKSDDPEQIALALCRAAVIHDKTYDDLGSALSYYERVLNEYAFTSSIYRALSGAVSCSRRMGRDSTIPSLYQRALRGMDPMAPGFMSLCREAIQECGANSDTGRLAKSLLDDLEKRLESES